MSTRRLVSLVCACGLLVGVSYVCPVLDEAPRVAAVPPGRAAQLALPFVENVGQLPAGVRYSAQTFAGSVHVMTDGSLVYALRAADGDDSARPLVLRERLLDASAASVTATERSPTKVGLFRGRDPSKWRSGVPAWSSVHVAGVRTGLDVEVRASGSNVEKVFRVPAGVDPAAIRVDVDGAQSLALGATGELEVATRAGTLRFTEPVAWQERDGRREFVDAAYSVDGDSYGFRVGDHDRSLPLVIDPLIASTYLGKGSDDWGRDIDVHWFEGDVYVAGSTQSPDWPADAGAWGMEYHGTDLEDAFVAKLTPDMTTLVAFAYLGGTGTDVAEGIAVGQRGVFVVGTTDSTDMPVVSAGPGPESVSVYGPWYHGGATDGWVANISHDLQTLTACTYHGGSGADRLKDVDATGGIRIAGETNSTDLWREEGAIQRQLAGGDDLFFASVREDLQAIDFASYFGGSGMESVSRITTGEGEVLATGRTSSTDFPTTLGAYGPTLSGMEDAFVLRISEDFGGLLASTYLGGALAEYEEEGGRGIAWTGVDRICVSGLSNAPDFPTTVGAWDTTPDPFGVGDAFVAVLDYDLTTLVASTLLGGSGHDAAHAIASDASSIYVAGATNSADFPAVTASIDTTYNGDGDAFVARFSPDLSELTGSTFLGGTRQEWVQAMAVRQGIVYVTGTTWGWDFPTTPGAYDSQYDTSGPQPDAFVTALALEPGTPATDSFILPRRVVVQRRARAERSSLLANGTFDTGSGAVEFSGPATLSVGGAEFAFPGLTENRRGVYRYKAPGVDLRIIPAKSKSSRAWFGLKVAGVPAAGIDLDAPLALRFRTGAVDGRGVVLLQKGRYKLGRVRGALIEPYLFPFACTAKVTTGAKDTLSLRLGLASGGVTPDTAPDFTLKVGTAFEQTLSSSSFVRKGNRWVFRGPPGALTSVTLDYPRERIVVTGRALEVGAFEQGPQPVRLTVRVGDAPEQAVLVRMVCKKVWLRY